MIELLGIAAGGASLLVAIGDVCCDRPGDLFRRSETLRLLSRKMVAGITQVRRSDTDRIDAWLSRHAGTTDISAEDREFFRTQLELARKEVAG